MQPTVVGGISMWSRWQADRSLYFNSWLVTGPGGAFAVDPLEPEDDVPIARCREAGVRAVVVTNRDHQRAAERFARELGVGVIAAEPDAASLSIPVERAVRDGDDCFGWRVIVLDGFKTPGEMVLYSSHLRAAIAGDAFWGAPAGALRLMPDDKLGDPVRALLSARRVRALEFDHLLVGDGVPVFGGARAALGAMLDARAAHAPVHRVNLDELAFTDRSQRPAFTAAAAEIGRLIGAERLGYAAVRLAPGQSWCPYHWHTREEELFVVWDGTPTLRTPAGTTELRRGDCIAFLTSERGAHRLSNESGAPCTVLMIANTDAGDVCFYPDSQKLLVERTGHLVRSLPALTYDDGE